MLSLVHLSFPCPWWHQLRFWCSSHHHVLNIHRLTSFLLASSTLLDCFPKSVVAYLASTHCRFWVDFKQASVTPIREKFGLLCPSRLSSNIIPEYGLENSWTAFSLPNPGSCLQLLMLQVSGTLVVYWTRPVVDSQSPAPQHQSCSVGFTRFDAIFHIIDHVTLLDRLQHGFVSLTQFIGCLPVWRNFVKLGPFVLATVQFVVYCLTATLPFHT